MFDLRLILALLSSTIITSNSRNMPGSKCVPEPKSMRMQLLVLRLTRIFSSFMSRCSTFLFLRVFTADNIYQKYFITHFRTRQKLLSNYDQTCLKNFWAVASSSDPFSVMKSNKSWKNIYRRYVEKYFQWNIKNIWLVVHLVAGGSAEDEDEAVWSLVEVEEPDDQSEMVTVITWLLSTNHGSPDDVLRVGRVSQQADLPRNARPPRGAPQPHLRRYVGT